MSGLEAAGVAIGIAPIVFKAIIEGLRFLDDTIYFDDDTEDFISGLRQQKLI